MAAQQNLYRWYVADSDGRYSIPEPVEAEQILDLAAHIFEMRIVRGDAFTSPKETASYLRARLAGNEREVFACLFLDNLHRIIEYEELFFGTINLANVHPREVVKFALQVNAAAVILAHNHPSGSATPGHADKAITERLKDALALVDIRLLDHFVVTPSDVYSFAESGLL